MMMSSCVGAATDSGIEEAENQPAIFAARACGIEYAISSVLFFVVGR